MCRSLVGHLPLVHLSFFDGIGIASEALRRISDNVLVTLSWETDEDCARFVEEKFGSIPMGDALHFQVDDVFHLVQQHTSHRQFIVLITAGPPCPDFSTIRQDPPGLGGESGWLLQHMLEIEDEIRHKFKGYPVETIMENVVPHPSIRDQLLQTTARLAMDPIVVDAADGKMVHRRRLWWTSAHWSDIDTKLSKCSPWSLSWTADDGWHRLHNPIAQELQRPIVAMGFSMPQCLQQGKKLFHCLTTPSTNTDGRTPPKPQTPTAIRGNIEALGG